MPRSLDDWRRSEATALPGWIKPQLTRLVDQAPDGPDWLHEIKFDGYRMHARLDRGAVRLLTRTGLDWTEAGSRSARRSRPPLSGDSSPRVKGIDWNPGGSRLDADLGEDVHVSTWIRTSREVTGASLRLKSGRPPYFSAANSWKR